MSNYSQSTNSGTHASDTAQNLSQNKQTFIDLSQPKARLNKSTSKSHGTHDSSSSSPSSLSPLASSLTRSVFHSELKTWLFSKSFPP